MWWHFQPPLEITKLIPGSCDGSPADRPVTVYMKLYHLQSAATKYTKSCDLQLQMQCTPSHMICSYRYMKSVDLPSVATVYIKSHELQSATCGLQPMVCNLWSAACGLQPAGAKWDGSSPSWEDMWHAIKAVWASKWNSRAVSSLSKAGLHHQDLQMSVLCQPVVPAQYAFVAHTTNPVTGLLHHPPSPSLLQLSK